MAAGLALVVLSSAGAEALVIETRTFLSIDPLVSSVTYDPGGFGFGFAPVGVATPAGSATENFELSGGFILVAEVFFGETWLRFVEVDLNLSPSGREAEFSLPLFLLRWSPDGSVYGDGNPCSTPLPPGTSCTGGYLGQPPSLSGTFDGTTLTVAGGTGRAQMFDPEFTYNFTARVEPVPAPASGLLAVAGVAALGLRRRRAAGRRSRG